MCHAGAKFIVTRSLITVPRTAHLAAGSHATLSPGYGFRLRVFAVLSVF